MNNNEHELVSDFLKKIEFSDSDVAIVGRENEIKEIISVISCGFGENNSNYSFGESNPLLVGYPGVGKTAIVEGLAKIFSQKENVPEYLKKKSIYQLSIISLIAGAKYQGQFEERVKMLISFIKNTKHILFIDEIHLIFNLSNKNQGGIDLYNSLKPILTGNDFCCIGATTFDEYKKNIEIDQAFSRRFKKIIIEPLSEKLTEDMLKRNSEKFEDFYFLKMNDDIFSHAVNLSKKYLPGYLPAKAISLLVETCGRVRSEKYYEPSYILKQKERLNDFIKNFKDKENSTSEIIILQERKKLNHLLNLYSKEKEEIQKLKEYRLEILELEEKSKKQRNNFDYNSLAETFYSIASIKEKMNFIENKTKYFYFIKHWISKEDISFTVSKKQKISVDRLNEKTPFLPLLHLKLKEKIKGQDEAVQSVSNSIIRSTAEIRDFNKPLSSFLFVGPTGVGKTELSLTISNELFGKNSFLRFDMTEYSEDITASRILGSPPGYVGFRENSPLDFIKQRGGGLVLFDEIEKGSQSVLNLFLQILDYGKLTLADGTEINFNNTMVIMTTNLGYEIYEDNKDKNKIEFKEELENELKKYFRPEFLNRFDEIIYFNPLKKIDFFEIIKNELSIIFERVSKNKNIKINCFDEKVIEEIYRNSHSYSYGARSVKRYIEKEIGNLIARGIVSDYFKIDFHYLLIFDEKTNNFKIVVTTNSKNLN